MADLFMTIKTLLWRMTLKYLVNPSKIVKVHGDLIMHLDNKDSLLLSLRTNYEPEHTKFMKSNVKKGDYVVDVGANIGYYTILLSKLVGENGKVFAFEPDPINFEVLKRNIKVNNLKNVILEQKALSDKNGKLRVYYSKINSGDSRTYNPTKVNNNKLKLMTDENDDRESVEVDCIKLDDYFKKMNSKPNFIKVDVQGFEPAVFNGMKNILKNEKIVFTTEYWVDGLKSAKYNPILFLEFLRGIGFNIYDLDNRKEITKFDDYSRFIEGGKCYSTLIGLRGNIHK